MTVHRIIQPITIMEQEINDGNDGISDIRNQNGYPRNEYLYIYIYFFLFS
jgi:hypothetical protein